jgi:hypothetical protein
VAHWGVDVSTRHVAIASIWPLFAVEPEELVREVRLSAVERNLEGGQRLTAIRSAAISAAECIRGCLPGLIVVEQPSGKTPNPSLSYAVGVVMEALHNMTRARVETCSSSAWKKTACGHGGLRKPKDSTPYPVLVWAQANGYDGENWDAADAWAIAEAARRWVTLEPR